MMIWWHQLIDKKYCKYNDRWFPVSIPPDQRTFQKLHVASIDDGANVVFN